MRRTPTRRLAYRRRCATWPVGVRRAWGQSTISKVASSDVAKMTAAANPMSR